MYYYNIIIAVSIYDWNYLIQMRGGHLGVDENAASHSKRHVGGTDDAYASINPGE